MLPWTDAPMWPQATRFETWYGFLLAQPEFQIAEILSSAGVFKIVEY
jgi:hypothetical protein